MVDEDEAPETSIAEKLEAAVLAAPVIGSREQLENFAAKTAGPGTAMEFGVAAGSSFRRIRDARKGLLFGFDSFEGLPTDWVMGPDRTLPQGTFQSPQIREDALPTNTHIVAGLFQDTLPGFLETYGEMYGKPITFVHIDSGLYESAAFVLAQLKPFLNSGVVVLFDEFMEFRGEAGDYPNWREGEFKALVEFIAANPEIEFRCIGRSDAQAVAFEIQ